MKRNCEQYSKKEIKQLIKHYMKLLHISEKEAIQFVREGRGCWWLILNYKVTLKNWKENKMN